MDVNGAIAVVAGGASGRRPADQLGDRARSSARDVIDEVSVRTALDLAGEPGLDNSARVVTANLTGTFTVIRLTATGVAGGRAGRRGTWGYRRRGVPGLLRRADRVGGPHRAEDGVVGMAFPDARDLADVLIRMAPR